MRNKFDIELKKIEQELVSMGALIEESIKEASNAILNGDRLSAKKAMEYEKEIDHKERDIESLCLKIIVEQQPVATDFRIVSATLKMITDMERIGDHAEDISEITLYLDTASGIYKDKKALENISKMADGTIRMVKDSIDAFVSRDIDLAYSVIKHDDIVDDLFDATKLDLVDFMSENKNNATIAIDLLMISKYFERIGDHAVNIAEWVIYTITGEHKSVD